MHVHKIASVPFIFYLRSVPVESGEAEVPSRLAAVEEAAPWRQPAMLVRLLAHAVEQDHALHHRGNAPEEKRGHRKTGLSVLHKALHSTHERELPLLVSGSHWKIYSYTCTIEGSEE